MLALGLAHHTVRLAPVDPRCPALCEAEVTGLTELAGVLAVAPIGSTAVPGLTAKPIIDIVASVASTQARHELIAPLATHGYQHGDSDTVEDRRDIERDDADGLRTHPLSVSVLGARFWRGHLAFRGALRIDVDLARTYEMLKCRLAARFADDRIDCSAANVDFIATASAEY